MKSAFSLLFVVALLVACGGNTSHSNDPNIHPAGSAAKGQQLIAKNDCLSCHKDLEPLVGPPYKAIADRYAGRPDAVLMLSGKIIRGGSGNWGQTPMTPHPGLSQQEAEEMVQYILSLK